MVDPCEWRNVSLWMAYSRSHLVGIRACYLKTLSFFLFLRNCLRSDWEASKLKIVITSITEGGALWIFGMPSIMISQGRNSVTQLHWWKHSMCTVCIWLCVHIEAITRFNSQTRLSERSAVWSSHVCVRRCSVSHGTYGTYWVCLYPGVFHFYH